MELYNNLDLFDYEVEKELVVRLINMPIEIDDIDNILEPNDFYFEPTREIYISILNIYNNSELSEIYSTSVHDDLKRRGKDDLVGGIDGIYDLRSTYSDYISSEKNAKIIKNYSICRQMMAKVNNIQNKIISTKNSTEIINYAQEQMLDIDFSLDNHSFMTISEIASEQWKMILNTSSRQEKGEFIGVPTGLKLLDEITNGFQKQNMIILAARPSMGKTALSLNICLSAAKQGKCVAIFSLEMSRNELINRMLSTTTNIPLKNLIYLKVPNLEINKEKIEENNENFIENEFQINKNQISENKFYEDISDGLQELANLNIIIDDRGGISPTYIRSQLKKMQSIQKIDFVMVDYLQLMNIKERVENRNLEIAKISMGLKNIAKEFDIPILVLSQLNRSVETRADKMPFLSDLRDSGSIEQDADIVMFLHREYQVNKNKEELKNIAELSIAKNRNGETGKIHIFFDGSVQKFSNLATKDLQKLKEMEDLKKAQREEYGGGNFKKIT